MPLRRLTEAELNRTAKTLLKNERVPRLDLGRDPDGEHGFTQAALDVPLERMMEVAEHLADLAVPQYDLDHPCDPFEYARTRCMPHFVRTFGRRAFRRPLTSREQRSYEQLYEEGEDGLLDLVYLEGLRLVASAMLQSPSFWYHWESGDSEAEAKGQVVRLPPFQLASRLSYFLWSDMPDDALLDAAEAGELSEDAQLEAQVERMLHDPRFDRTVQQFHAQWLGLRELSGLSKDQTLFPEWTPPLKKDLLHQAQHYLSDLFARPKTTVSDLLTSSFSYVNGPLAAVYGFEKVTGAELRKVNVDGTRAGLLAQPAVIALQANAATTNPARAGKTIYTLLLCRSVDPPPPGATQAFMYDAAMSTRENFAQLEDVQGCSGCHTQINPLGFAFEAFDAIGRTRKHDGVHAVDASGHLSSNGAAIHFDGVGGLERALAASPEVHQCLARTWLRFALGRKETPGDRYSLEGAYQTFEQEGYDLKQLLKGIATSRTFRYRMREEGEVL